MRFFNFTPHPALAFRFRGTEELYRRIAVMRATFAIDRGGALIPLGEAPPLNLAERCYGEMLRTAPRDESHLAPEKARADVIVHADAYAPRGRPAASFDVGLRVRGEGRVLLDERLRVTGPRAWQRGAMGAWRLGEPTPVDRVPLRYDLAFGGTIRFEVEAERPPVVAHDANPVGRGFVPTKEEVAEALGVSTSTGAHLVDGWLERSPTLPAPQVEHVDAPLRTITDRPSLAGWGLLAKHWADRYRHAGTYDAAWAESRYPLLPEGFDARYWNGAHPRLQLDAISPDAEIELHGVVPAERAEDQRLSVRLPGFAPRMRWRDVAEPGERERALRLDTVVVDLLEDRLTLLYRGDVPDTVSLAWMEIDLEERA